MPILNYNGKNILFIHIPKTAGTTIQDWLQSLAPIHFFSAGIPPVLRCPPQHLRAKDFFELFGIDYFDYIFTIVRNPFDRIESEFRMRKELGKNGFWKEFPSFSLWLELSLGKFREDAFYMHHHLRPQNNFISKNTEVFFYEEGIENIVSRISHRIGAPNPNSVGHRNKINKENHSIKWDIPDISIVQDVYKRDFELFGYEIAK